jgi:antitoxin component YwqK of YwqJK toxin-antitoxin module
MKAFFFSFFIVTSIICHSQTIEKYYDYRWEITNNPREARYYSVTEFRDSLWFTNDYFVFERSLQMTGSYRDSSQKIRHGEFTWYHPNGYLERKGRFDNNNYTGSWVSYHPNGIMMDSAYYVDRKKYGISLGWHYNGYMADSTFSYSDGTGISVQWFDNGIPSAAGRMSAGGKRNGKWQFFHKNGKLSALETYENGQIMDREYYDEQGGTENKNINKDRDAEFPGGSREWLKFLNKHIYWPRDLQFETPGMAVVMVRFAIDEEGKISDAYVSLPLHPEFDRIALRAIKQSPKWIPAISHNRKIKVYRTQPITFVQQE